MKKELILLACMTVAPCLLNSAGRWTDTTGINTPKDTQNYPALNNRDPMCYRLEMPDQIMNLPERCSVAYAPDSGSHSMSDMPVARALLERKQTKIKSSIRANWILDTAASQRGGALVYMDKDNPELKAVIFTDNAGNMLMRLEQEGKYHEIRVKKIEFHTSVNTYSRKRPLSKWDKSGVALHSKEQKETISGIQKGVGVVPV